MKKLNIPAMNAGRLVIGLVIVAIGLQVNWPQQSVRAQDESRAGLVIQHGDGNVTTECISFASEEISGYELLAASDFDLNIDANNSMGVTICSIEGEGCAYPQDQCFCECTSTPCTYWNYWQLDGDNWVHSGFGASNSIVKNGDVEAWSWSTTGDMADEPESAPPVKTFLEICEPDQFAATATAVAAETATAEAATVETATAEAATMTAEAPTATNTPTLTFTPAPTAIPSETPVPPPLITVLNADRQEITAGESVVLTWETSGADSVVLRKPDNSEQTLAVTGQMTINPATTTTYTLIARNNGGEDRIPITISVLPAEQQNPQPTATASDGESPLGTPTTTATASGGESPPETPTPTVQQTQPDSLQPAPTSTAIIISAPPATPTPVQQPTDPVIIISAPPNTPTPAPTSAPTETPIPATLMATPTETVAGNAIPDSSAPASAESLAAEPASAEPAEIVAVTDTVASEADSATGESQLLTIFMGMVFIMALPLILGMAWMAFRAFGGKRQ